MHQPDKYKLVECPRDAMQGIKTFIPTKTKIDYLNLLLKVGFDTLDFGSFVSPKAIPQLADTAEVLAGLDLSTTKSKLLAIVANARGAKEACQHPEINFLGYPFSISETFQQRNTHSSIAQSAQTVDEILNLCDKTNKKAVVYISMGFGNPYGDAWNYEIIEQWATELIKKGVSIISLADTVGSSTPSQITDILTSLIKKFTSSEIGIHLHCTEANALAKIEATYTSGCTRIDGALKGFGGCPMAEDRLTGNIATEQLMGFLEEKGHQLTLNKGYWNEAMAFSTKIFG
ncbi:hydroxymethylglutaryl-CoA lyase [Pedobacter sp. UYP30]|uniref:hydroxymethylglutaryl-CoA lyase n=1 Tax=Pedobacter sp. UYP30 TaxID=1756400 RepID=UPI0033974CA8